MRLNRVLFTILLAFLSTSIVMATTWATMLPYVQHTENGTIETHSIPYETNRGPFGKGETIVYANGKPLYHINEYFSEPFYTTNEGRYLITYNFACNLHQFKNHNGNAVNIYRNGKLLHSVKHSELEITPKALEPWEAHLDLETWNYQCPEKEADSLKLQMARHPAFIEDGMLFLITSDQQLIGIDIVSGKITSRNKAYETLKNRVAWAPETVLKEYGGSQFPSDLPLLKNGKTFEEGLTMYLGREASHMDDSNISVYIRSLLLNRNGQCEAINCTPFNITESDVEYDEGLQVKIENWVLQTHFQTTTIPANFTKYCYSASLHFK